MCLAAPLEKSQLKRLQAEKTKKICSKRKHPKQDKLNTADSAFKFLIILSSFDQSKLMVRLVRAEKIVLSGLVFARKIARMILIQNL